MIATVSPGASACDHTLNTLRYADRVKEKKVGQKSEEAVREAKIEHDAKVGNRNARGGGGYVGEDEFLKVESLPPAPNPKARKSNPAARAAYSPARNESKREVDGRDGELRPAGPKPSRQRFSRSPPQSPQRNGDAGLSTQNLNDDDAYLTESKYEESGRLQSSSAPNNDDDDIDLLHASLRGQNGSGTLDDDLEEEGDAAELHRTVQKIFEDEENLLNLHMSIIQENAELLTAEGKLLQKVQGEDDYNIDDYASKLEFILERKSFLISQLNEKLKAFRLCLAKEEKLSKKVNLSSY